MPVAPGFENSRFTYAQWETLNALVNAQLDCVAFSEENVRLRAENLALKVVNKSLGDDRPFFRRLFNL